MKQSIKQELLSHVIDHLQDVYLVDESQDLDDLHHTAFNEDYYIIGYYNAEQWFKEHDVSAWEAIREVIEWEQSTLGEVSLKADDINPERVVNLYVYVLGEELLSGYDLDQEVRDLINEMEERTKTMKNNKRLSKAERKQVKQFRKQRQQRHNTTEV